MSLLIKKISWVCAVLLLALSFPLQVLFNNSNMALLAYIPAALIYLLPAARRVPLEERRARHRLTGMDILVMFYAALILGHVFAALLADEISSLEGFRQIFLFIVPATFYFYVSRSAREEEFRPIFVGIVIAALIVGLYFAYDSFVKIILQQVGSYQIRANEYSVARTGVDNPVRVAVGGGSRSMGLLETHTLSGAWIGFGAFASFFLLAARSKVVRWGSGLGWLILLVVGINFTSIVGFLAVVFIVYSWRGAGLHSLLRVRRSALRLAVILICLAFAAVKTLCAYSSTFANYIVYMTSLQLSKVFSLDVDPASPASSWFGWTFMALKHYMESAARHPFVLFFGTGPVMSDSFSRGSDAGLVETLALLGLPLFSLIVLGLFKITRDVCRELRSESACPATAGRRGFLEFGLAVVLFIVIFDVHYSVWCFKSVSPFLFIALGLMRRYSPSAALPKVEPL